MTEELRKKLSALRAVAPRLNHETDEAAKVVEAVEKFLEGLSLGVSAENLFDSNAEAIGDDDTSQTDREFYLAYGRVGGKFRLHVAEKLSRTDDRTAGDDAQWANVDVSRTPWTSCPREMKLKSFASLPFLLGRIADEANRLTEGAAETSATVRDLLEALGEVKPFTFTLADVQQALHFAIDDAVGAYAAKGLSKEAASKAVGALLRERAEDPMAPWAISVGTGEPADEPRLRFPITREGVPRRRS